MDALGDRMKDYEAREAARSALPLLPICLRLDGRGFSRWTKGLPRPYDERLHGLMVDVTRALVEETGARVGYTQSDEISLVLYSDDYKSETFLGGKFQKLTSICASFATARFNADVPDRIPEKTGLWAMFDCRAWTMPTLIEAANVLVWREIDATKNSVQMAARTVASHKALEGKGRADQMDILMAAGINWNDYPDGFKRGTYVIRERVTRGFTAEEVRRLPPMHVARREPDLVVERTDIRAVNLPPKVGVDALVALMEVARV